MPIQNDYTQASGINSTLTFDYHNSQEGKYHLSFVLYKFWQIIENTGLIQRKYTLLKIYCKYTNTPTNMMFLKILFPFYVGTIYDTTYVHAVHKLIPRLVHCVPVTWLTGAWSNWILYGLVFSRLRRIFHTVGWGMSNSREAQFVDFDGLRT
jgi:hypothetical protein